jgi:hypothetical protein
MGIFTKITKTGLEETNDRLGGYAPVKTDIYTGPIKQAYCGKSKGGAENITLIIDHGGREYRETIYYTNKQGENFFIDKNDKNRKVPLPGFVILDEICMVTTGSDLAAQEEHVEEKMVKVYDADAKKELPKSVPVITSLIGQVVSLGIGELLENKNEKQGDEFVPIAETRVSNVIEKVFHTETKMTVPEARQGLEKGVFWDAWVERNKGLVRDKRKIKDGAAGAPGGGLLGRPGGRALAGPPTAGSAQSAPKKSLFGAKNAA